MPQASLHTGNRRAAVSQAAADRQASSGSADAQGNSCGRSASELSTIGAATADRCLPERLLHAACWQVGRQPAKTHRPMNSAYLGGRGRRMPVTAWACRQQHQLHSQERASKERPCTLNSCSGHSPQGKLLHRGPQSSTCLHLSTAPRCSSSPSTSISNPLPTCWFVKWNAPLPPPPEGGGFFKERNKHEAIKYGKMINGKALQSKALKSQAPVTKFYAGS